MNMPFLKDIPPFIFFTGKGVLSGNPRKFRHSV